MAGGNIRFTVLIRRMFNCIVGKSGPEERIRSESDEGQAGVRPYVMTMCGRALHFYVCLGWTKRKSKRTCKVELFSIIKRNIGHRPRLVENWPLDSSSFLKNRTWAPMTIHSCVSKSRNSPAGQRRIVIFFFVWSAVEISLLLLLHNQSSTTKKRRETPLS